MSPTWRPEPTLRGNRLGIVRTMCEAARLYRLSLLCQCLPGGRRVVGRSGEDFTFFLYMYNGNFLESMIRIKRLQKHLHSTSNLTAHLSNLDQKCIYRNLDYAAIHAFYKQNSSHIPTPLSPLCVPPPAHHPSCVEGEGAWEAVMVIIYLYQTCMLTFRT